MSAWLVKTRRAPSRHSRDARVYGHTTTAMHHLSITPFLPPPAAPPATPLPWCAGARGGQAREVREGAKGAGRVGQSRGGRWGGVRLAVWRGGEGLHDLGRHFVLPFPGADRRDDQALQGDLGSKLAGREQQVSVRRRVPSSQAPNHLLRYIIPGTRIRYTSNYIAKNINFEAVRGHVFSCQDG